MAGKFPAIKLPMVGFLSSLKQKRAALTASVVVLIVVGASVPSYYFYTKYKKVEKELQAKDTLGLQTEMEELVQKVGRLVVLPQGESPQIATVQDKSQLPKQPFFEQTENGDKLLVYLQAKKVYLYRPSLDRIVDISPVNPEATAAGNTMSTVPSVQSVSTQKQKSSWSVVILNGTSVVGLTKKFENTLKGQYPESQVLDRDNAKRTDYKQSILVDVAGNYGTLAKEISQQFGLSQATLPAPEATPSSDFLIILGEDKK